MQKPLDTIQPNLNKGALETIVRFTEVGLGYADHRVLSDLNIELVKGQIMALIGGSGAGKSTVIRGISGQIPPQTGRIELFGHDLGSITKGQLSQLRQRMGVLFQQGALFTDLNVFENVAYPLRELTQDDETTIFNKVLDKLEAVGLRHAAHLQIAEVSGGMARRVALARAIIMEPDLVLYDEPFAGLDPVSMGMIARLIRELNQRMNCASILITHDIEESFRIVNYVYMLGKGRVLAHGLPQELRNSDDVEIQRFLDGKPATDSSYEYPVTPAFEVWLKSQVGAQQGVAP